MSEPRTTSIPTGITTGEVVQDVSTNNTHLRGLDREDGSATALCNRRYQVVTYRDVDAQAGLQQQFRTWGNCPRCSAKAVKAALAIRADGTPIVLDGPGAVASLIVGARGNGKAIVLLDRVVDAFLADAKSPTS